jgi:Tol biopolymer transport system component
MTLRQALQRKRAGWTAVVAAFLVGSAGTGCMTAIGGDELGDEPNAFVYYDVETTRRRAEMIRDSMEGDEGQSISGKKRGVAEGKKVARFLKETVGYRGDDPKFLGRLALLDPRTRKLRVVEGARKGAVPQDWSADHERLLFTQVVHNDRPQLFELEVATGRIGPMTHGREAHPEGCYGPNGSIVYTSVDTSRAARGARIMLYDPLEKRPRQISGADQAYYPTCSPDGGEVAYSSIPATGGAQRIMIQSLEPGAEPRLLTSGKEPAFSADGSLIVFSAKRKGEWSLWRIRPDGKGRMNLGYGGYAEHRPNLSSDNQLVLYVADTTTNQRLFLRRVDGSGDRIFFEGGDGDRPIW